MLRLLGLNTTPEHHAAFFRDGLRGLPAAPRVLISGTADYSLLARLLPAFEERGMRPHFTVVDRCETALMLNRWYAQRAGLEIATARSDALEHAAAPGFDLICTHSFLGQFDAARRAQLLAAWHRMLRPDGLLLTINRLRPDAAPDWLGYTAQQAEKLSQNVRQGAGEVAGLVGATADELAAAALRYARHMGAWPVRSEDEIRSLCEASGFRVEHLASQPVVLAAGKEISGPTMPGGAPYAHLAARRP